MNNWTVVNSSLNFDVYIPITLFMAHFFLVSTLHSLPNLVNIMKGAWPPLENISFYDCPMLKKLGIDSNLIQTIKEIKAGKDWWEELE